MGSLSSSAKAPQQVSPQVVYVPAPSTSSTPTQPTAQETAQDREKQVSDARAQTLLRRNRGRFGTIATGLQGFLSETISNGRKTLLGE